MKIQYIILLFIVCINLSITIAVGLGFPGTEYMSPFQGGGDVDDYTARFNSTEVAQNWQSKRFSGIPIIGDVFSGIYFFFENWEFLVSGFSYVIRWIGDSYMTSSVMRSAFDLFANGILAVYAIIMATFMIYLITGREI